MRRLQSDNGATLVEYALMLAFIFAAAFMAVQVFGGRVGDLFESAVDLWP